MIRQYPEQKAALANQKLFVDTVAQLHASFANESGMKVNVRTAWEALLAVVRALGGVLNVGAL